jgi:hypothetical protein
MHTLARTPYISPRKKPFTSALPGGYSAVADASKQFHNFKTKPLERLLLGCIQPITRDELV